MPQTLPVLYSFRRCPYAMRARLALHVSGVVYEHREVVLKNKPAHMLALSPKGTVPVLWIQDGGRGQVLDQSLDIMMWALQQNDPQSWCSPTPEQGACAVDWIALNDGPFKQHLDRYKYPMRFQLDSGVRDRDLGGLFLWQMDAQLQAHGFLHGPHWGLSDAALAPFVRQFAKVDPVWFAAQRWTALKNWLACFENSPACLQIMQKMPIWCSEPLQVEHPPQPDTTP